MMKNGVCGPTICGRRVITSNPASNEDNRLGLSESVG